MGLMLRRHRGVRTIGHDGTAGGYQASVQRFPELGFVVVALCNLTDVDAYALATGVADIVLEGVLPPRAAVTTPPPAALAALSKEEIALAGLYHEPSSGELRRIFVRDGKLHAIAGGVTPVGEGAVMAALGPNRYSLFDGAVTMQFTPSVPGRREVLREAVVDGRSWVYQLEPPAASASAPRGTYAGLYDSPDLLVTYRVIERGSGLVLMIRSGDEIVLQQVFEDAFAGAAPAGLIRFTRNARKLVTGFTLTGGRVRNLQFNRVR
jgi:hypothetical protein